MLYICDFYAHQKEAISNQIEILHRKTNGKLFAAAIFMEQKFMRISDVRENRFIFPRFFFYLFFPLVVIFSRRGIHIFEEDPSLFQKIFLNLSSSPLYISLYRRPTDEYVTYLKQLRNLRVVFVEMESHQDALIKRGICRDMIKVIHPPALFPAVESTKLFNPQNVRLLFGSWNKGNYQALRCRGVLSLLEMVSHNPFLNLTILLRDRETTLLAHLIEKKNLSDRVFLILIQSREELRRYYQETDFVAFLPQMRVTKDIPNSILDGFSCGKPCIISTTVDFSKTVSEQSLGLVLCDTTTIMDFRCTEEQYKNWSENAFRYVQQYTRENYEKIVEHYHESVDA